MLPNNLRPTGARVLLEFVLQSAEMTVGKIIIPEASQKNVKPKYRWLEVLATGNGCGDVKVGDEVLVFEANLELVVVPGEAPLNYIQEGQIMMVRDAKVAKKAG